MEEQASPYGVVLFVPVAGLVVFEGAQLVLGERSPGLSILSLVSMAAAIVGLLLLWGIRLGGAAAAGNRERLLTLFKPGLHLAALGVAGLVLIHALIAIATLWFLFSLIGRIPIGIIVTIVIAAIAGAGGIIKGVFSLVRTAEAEVMGKSISREEAGELWSYVEGIAERVGVSRPENIVLGLDPNFFVTEARVRCSNGELSGRSLYASLPLLRVLEKNELATIVGHELGHFKGEDIEFTKKFYPIYSGTARAIESLSQVNEGGGGSLLLVPALAILGHFMATFALAERAIGRSRELAADAVGVSVVDRRTTAAALVKVHAFTPVWVGLHEEIRSSLQARAPISNLSKRFAEKVAEGVTLQALQDVANAHLSHPTDTHPPLLERLEALGLRLDDVADDALRTRPTGAAIGILPAPEAIEAELSEAYQRAFATMLWIDLDAPPPREPTEKETAQRSQKKRMKRMREARRRRRP